MKNVAISQPRYLPWLGYLQRMIICDAFVFLDHVQYSPRDWENRVMIKMPRGAHWMTVPVHAPKRSSITDVLCDNNRPWQKEHWSMINDNYSKSVHFRQFADRFYEFYRQEPPARLVDVNRILMRTIMDYLNVDWPEIEYSSNLKVEGAGSEMLASICESMGATRYISGPLGRQYLELEPFRRLGIEVVVSRFEHPVYPQLFSPFIPGLSCIDALCNIGSEVAALLNNAESWEESL